MTRYAIGLGSNLGDRLEHLTDACSSLAAVGELVAVSSVYETAPVGGPVQDPYLNAVVVIDSDLDPAELLTTLHNLEQEHHRERRLRWGPRTLDLDIVAADGLTVDRPELVIPHPRAADREFVLRPLVEVWPEALVGEQLSARAALGRTSSHGVDLLLRDWVRPRSRWPSRLLLGGQLLMFVLVAFALAYDGTLPEGDVTALRVVGAALAMTGLGLAFIASRRLGPALRAGPEPAPAGSLVMRGPYRYARHPIYGGLVLVMTGTSLVLDSLAGLAASLGLLAFFWGKSIYEERLLRLRYPGYRDYRQVVTRRLIPFVL